MAKKFKDYYDHKTAKLLADKISKVYLPFDSQNFIKDIKMGVFDLEFLARQDFFVETLEKYLPKKYEKQVSIFHKILGPELKTETGMFTYGYFLWPIGRFIEKNALKNPEVSLKFIYELTKRFTGEFAIRPLLKNNPKKILKVMEKWSKDKNVHVRRLSSEGIRISLPWTQKLDLYKNFSKECFLILENLKNAREKFVQKSVGNNLNDLSKQHPELFLKITKKWQKGKPAKETLWILKHGHRTIKKLAKK